MLSRKGGQARAKYDHSRDSVLIKQGIVLLWLHSSPPHSVNHPESPGRSSRVEINLKVGLNSIQKAALNTIDIKHRFESTQETRSQPTTQLTGEQVPGGAGQGT